MNWDDFRILSAVRDAGTYLGAGRLLKIDETTVARRVARLERAFNGKLFEAADGLRSPTARCDAVLRHVDAMSRHVTEIEHIRSSDQGKGLSARLRIAATHALAEEILTPNLPSLLRTHEGLTLELLTSSANVNFSRWEADIALRLKKPDRGNFSIARVATIPLYLFEPRQPFPAGREPIVCAYPDDLSSTPEQAYLQGRGLVDRARVVTSSVRVIRRMIASHVAIGVLPAHLSTDLLSDQSLRATQLPQGREVWLLVQDHLKRDPATRTVAAWIKSAFKSY